MGELLGCDVALRQPGAEVDGPVELENGVGAGVLGQRLTLGFGTHFGQMVPGAEPPQHALVGMPGQFSEPLVQPGVESVQGAVNGGQASRGNEQSTQVPDALLVRLGIESGVAQCKVAVGKRAE